MTRISSVVWVCLGAGAVVERSELRNRIHLARRDLLEKAESEPAEAG